MGISESKMARWKARLQPMQATRTKPSSAPSAAAAAASSSSSTSRLEGEKPSVSEFERWTAGEPYVHPGGLLLEGPFYEAQRDVLRFIDIKKHLVHSISLKEGPASLTTIELDGPVGVTADIAGVDPAERIIVGMRHGLAVLDRKTGKYEYIAKYSSAPGAKTAPVSEGASEAVPVDDPRTRSNDGAADINGRYWIGTMTDFGLDLEAEGHLYRFDGTKSILKFKSGLKIPNSVGWSPDNRTMYFTHSTEQTIYAYDYDPATGEATNERVFYHHKGPGDPDGFRIDADGNMWHAIYGGFNVLKINPQGKLVGEVKLPTRNITCVEFVGTDLFITTASDDDAEGGEESKRLGGALYRVPVGVKGLPQNAFKLDA